MLAQTFWKFWNNQKFRFLAVGGVNTIIGYFLSLATYALLSQMLHIVIIGIINAILSITISFLGQRIIVFRSKASWLPEYLRMYVVNAISMLIGIALLWLFVDKMSIPFWLAQGIIIILSTIYMYFFHIFYTFRRI